MMLEGKNLFLRALEPSDLDFLYQLENDELVWEVSNTASPYSKYVLKQYLENAHRDIYEVKQLRLVICLKENQKAIGFIDLFDFDPRHRRAGLGIIIFSEMDRGKGYAKETLQLIKSYCFNHLNLHQLYANIGQDNAQSIALFEKMGYLKSGEKTDWIWSKGVFKNECIYQLLNEQS